MSNEREEVSNAYEGHERRSGGTTIILTEEQLDTIAERAAAKVLEKFQLEVGKLTIRGFLYLCGAAGLALAAYLHLGEKVKL